MYCDTARPSLVAGVNWILLAAAIAFSVNPYGKLLNALMLVTAPLEEKTILKVTVPVI
jgi:hypothetical protein